MDQKKVVYIAGPITGVDKYWEAFEQAEDYLLGLGYIPLSPAHLPEGMTKAQYARIDFAQIDSADAVLFLPGWEESEGAKLEKAYCRYISKPVAILKAASKDGVYPPKDITLAWLKHDLEEVLSK